MIVPRLAETGPPSKEAPTFIRIEALHKTYHLGDMDVPVLKGVGLTIERGEMVAIMGVSGSGKTTLMNILGCLDQATAGKYILEGEEVGGLSERDRALLRNQTIGFVFQNFNLLARTTALDNVMMPLAYSANTQSQAECRKRAQTLLARVGLADRMGHEPSQLSGGQQQRVAIARALVNRPSLLFADEPTGNLDSKTSQEVLQMFQQLNAEDGITVLLVTHDETVARHARRIIHIRDGLIWKDERVAEPLGMPAAPAVPEPAPGAVAPKPAARPRPPRLPSLMGLYRTSRLAFQALRRNILRSFLTTLGIIIGVAAIIAIIEIGEGASTAIRDVLTSMGANNLIVQPGTASTGGVSQGSGTVRTLTPGDAEAIQQECPAVRGVAPLVLARSQVVHKNRNWSPGNIYGTTPGYLEVRDWTDMAQGRSFTDQEVRSSALVCVIGETLVRELFPNESPLGKSLQMQNVPFKVIGVLSKKGVNIIGFDQDDILLAPLTSIRMRVSGGSGAAGTQVTTGDVLSKINTLNTRYPGRSTGLYPEMSSAQLANTPLPARAFNLDFILVRANTTEEIPAAMEQVTELLRERHRLAPDADNDFAVRDLAEIIKTMQRTVGMVTALLACVALISLVVGGVGIMNIMLVSVTERTREIGIRMAVGASTRAILRQFLTEAVALCLLGGALGMMLGEGASQLVQRLLHWQPETSLLAIAVAVGASVTVGVIFGYYPAWKASRLNPIEALRYE